MKNKKSDVHTRLRSDLEMMFDVADDYYDKEQGLGEAIFYAHRIVSQLIKLSDSWLTELVQESED